MRFNRKIPEQNNLSAPGFLLTISCLAERGSVCYNYGSELISGLEIAGTELTPFPL